MEAIRHRPQEWDQFSKLDLTLPLNGLGIEIDFTVTVQRVHWNFILKLATGSVPLQMFDIHVEIEKHQNINHFYDFLAFQFSMHQISGKQQHVKTVDVF